MPDARNTIIIEEQQTWPLTSPKNKLLYWVGRADRSQRIQYLQYRGMNLVISSARAARINNGEREVWIGDEQKYKRRGWVQRFTADIEQAITHLEAGLGDPIKQMFGDQLREELDRRRSGITPEFKMRWFEWLETDELQMLMGVWLIQSGCLSHHIKITLQETLDFCPVGEEFDLSFRAVQSKQILTILQRLAHARASNHVLNGEGI